MGRIKMKEHPQSNIRLLENERAFRKTSAFTQTFHSSSRQANY